MYPLQLRDIRRMDKPVVRFLPARENTLEIEIEIVTEIERFTEVEIETEI